MRPDTDAWFRARTSRAADWPLQLLMRAKGSTRVSVVLPARNEAATVGPIVEAIHAGIGPGAPEDRRLVDELVVLDSGSTDATAAVAAAAGASVVRARRGAARACRLSPARARPCGARSPRRPATCSCSSTPTCARSRRRTSPGCSALPSPTRASRW